MAISEALRNTPVSPCLRCGADAPLPVGEAVDELFVYLARMTRRSSGRTDIDTNMGPNGRLCRTCTPIVLAAITPGK